MALVVVRVDELIERLCHLLVASGKLGHRFFGFLLETLKVRVLFEYGDDALRDRLPDGAAIEALTRALHHLPDRFLRQAVYVHHDHHARAQITESEVLDDEAVVIELLPLTIDEVDHAALSAAGFEIAGDRGRALLIEHELLALFDIEGEDDLLL